MRTTNPLDKVFFALSDVTRRGILAQLTQGTATVGELAKPYAMSAPAISKHIRILEDAGLLRRQKQGREHHCTLVTQSLKSAEEWLQFHREFWDTRLAALDDLFRRRQTTRSKKEK